MKYSDFIFQIRNSFDNSFSLIFELKKIFEKLGLGSDVIEDLGFRNKFNLEEKNSELEIFLPRYVVERRVTAR